MSHWCVAKRTAIKVCFDGFGRANALCKSFAHVARTASQRIFTPFSLRFVCFTTTARISYRNYSVESASPKDTLY